MLNITFYWEINLVVILSAISAILVYLTYSMTKRINKQQSKLIALDIANKEIELEDIKHAKLRITQLEKSTKANFYSLRIENYGKCKAENITISIINKYTRMVGFQTTIPSTLEAETHYDVGFLCYEDIQAVEYVANWTDKAGKNTLRSQFSIL